MREPGVFAEIKEIKREEQEVQGRVCKDEVERWPGSLGEDFRV